jgi:alkylated DNA repair dioxygenase AlkB
MASGLLDKPWTAREGHYLWRMNAPSRRRVQPSEPFDQTDLFAAPTGLPEGFRYHPDVLSVGEEEALARELAQLPFKPFDFHGYLANRQVVSFGYRYDYDRRAVVEAAPLPSFLEPLRRKVAATFDRPADTFRQVLINEYRPGAGIGWHRDKAQFEEVVGVSLLAPCSLRFRRKTGDTWERASLKVEPRSAYLLSGSARTLWEHSIPALDRLRYSITFRTLAAKAADGASAEERD